MNAKENKQTNNVYVKCVQNPNWFVEFWSVCLICRERKSQNKNQDKS